MQRYLSRKFTTSPFTFLPEWKSVAKLVAPANNTSFEESPISSMISAGVHLGHSIDNFHPNMLPYIYGRRSGIHVINLEHTLSHLRRAVSVTSQIASKGGIVLFVGDQKQQAVLRNCSKISNQFYVSGKWLEGCLQNHEQTLQSVGNGKFLQPDLVIFLNVKDYSVAIKEATNCPLPTIGLCDTDCDPLLVTYPIPGNDDATSSVELISYVLAKAATRK